MQLRVKFELLEESESLGLRYKTVAGKTLVFKKLATQGSLLGVIEALTVAGVEEAKRWTAKRS